MKVCGEAGRAPSRNEKHARELAALASEDMPLRIVRLYRMQGRDSWQVRFSAGGPGTLVTAFQNGKELERFMY